MADELRLAKDAYEKAVTEREKVEQENAKRLRDAKAKEQQKYERYCLELGKQQFKPAKKGKQPAVGKKGQDTATAPGLVTAGEAESGNGNGARGFTTPLTRG